MIKKFNIEVDCANCAAKIETAINEMPDVNNASINFMAQKLILDAPEEHMERLIKEIKKAARRIEPDFEMEC
ncbi:MAG: cation transporter [Candidatus Fournierella pullistercoris]|uniref:Cation transporter n=1 Tax=Candidatus Allofournierella pullistercoris TaxID=2838597 RepID=A0A948SZU6_9FIRM|nr:cation transporter [Candidatus Fournierella pullistercoris]